MNKQEFANALRAKLTFLPPAEVDDRLNFYLEAIDDRMDDGWTEEEAVAQMGAIDEIVTQILSDTPLTSLLQHTLTARRRPKTWEIVLLVLGSPIWLSLAFAAAAVVLAVYVSLWSVIVSLWATFASLVGGAIGGVTSGAVLAAVGHVPTGLMLIACALMLSGLSIGMFFGCRAATKGMAALTKRLAVWIKRGFAKKEVA